VSGYQEDATLSELAARFDVHRTTVSAALERAGVAPRWRILGPEGVVRATELYGAALSCGAIGVELGVHADTIWRSLHKAGVHMRDPQGRPRSQP